MFFYYSGNCGNTFLKKFIDNVSDYVECVRISQNQLGKFNKTFIYEHEIDLSNPNLYEHKKGFWNNTPSVVKQQIQYRNGHLLMSLPSEGDTNQFFDNFIPYLKTIDLPPNKVLYATGSINAVDAYSLWCKRHYEKEEIKILYYPYFEDYYVDRTKEINPTGLTNRNKKFICLNRVLSTHRPLFVSLLIKYNLLELGIVSLFKDDGCLTLGKVIPEIFGSDIYRESNDKFKQDVNDGFKVLKQIAPIIADSKDGSHNFGSEVSYELHHQAYFNVIAASRFESFFNELHLTEKEFKPILCKQPFICLALPGQLNALKKLGYKTFDKWFNESYDEELNDAKRMMMVLEETKRLSELTNDQWDVIIREMQPILEYNYYKLLHHHKGTAVYNSNVHDLLEYIET